MGVAASTPDSGNVSQTANLNLNLNFQSPVDKRHGRLAETWDWRLPVQHSMYSCVFEERPNTKLQ